MVRFEVRALELGSGHGTKLGRMWLLGGGVAGITENVTLVDDDYD